MKTLRNLVLLSLVAFMFVGTGCKKYEEGPAFSFRSKKARVVNQWEVVKLLKNGVEQDMHNNNYTMMIWFDFNDDNTGKAYLKLKNNSTGNLDLDTSYSYRWDFNDDKTKLVFTYETGDKDEDEILKLYEKEMWLKEKEDNGDEVEYHLEPR